MDCIAKVESIGKGEEGSTTIKKLVVKIGNSGHVEPHHRTSGNVFFYGSDYQAMRNYD